MIVIDDRLLRAVLVADESARLSELRSKHQTATTSCWLYRLCQAAASRSITGILSGPIAALPFDLRRDVIARLVHLPDEIALISWRELSWSMGDLAHRHSLNLLALEALAVSKHLEAGLVMHRASPPPRLVEAARIEGVAVTLV